jgi:hypothetical protein
MSLIGKAIIVFYVCFSARGSLGGLHTPHINTLQRFAVDWLFLRLSECLSKPTKMGQNTLEGSWSMFSTIRNGSSSATGVQRLFHCGFVGVTRKNRLQKSLCSTPLSLILVSIVTLISYHQLNNASLFAALCGSRAAARCASKRSIQKVLYGNHEDWHRDHVEDDEAWDVL